MRGEGWNQAMPGVVNMCITSVEAGADSPAGGGRCDPVRGRRAPAATPPAARRPWPSSWCALAPAAPPGW